MSLPIRINRGFCSGPGLAGFVPMVSLIHGPDPGLRIFSRRRVVGFTCNGSSVFFHSQPPSEVPVVIWGAPGCGPPGFGAGLVAGGWLPAGLSRPPCSLFAKALLPCRFVARQVVGLEHWRLRRLNILRNIGNLCADDFAVFVIGGCGPACPSWGLYPQRKPYGTAGLPPYTVQPSYLIVV